MKKNKNPLRGQVVVEYILVIAVIVGIALVAYTALKNKMKPHLTTFKKKVEDDSATAGKPMETYYNKVELKTK
jgi:hypothetical protein